MIKQLKKAAHRTLIWLIAATMVLGLTTDAMITTTKAYGPNGFELVEIEGKYIYLYGADSAVVSAQDDEGKYTITYTGGTSNVALPFIVDGKEVNDAQEVTFSERKIIIQSTWIKSGKWFAFKCDEDSSISLPSKQPTDKDKPDIEVTSEDVSEGELRGKLTLKIKASDTTSRPSYYYYELNGIRSDDTFAYDMEDDQRNQVEVKSNGVYLFYVVDLFGNKSWPAKITVDCIDDQGPDIDSYEFNPKKVTTKTTLKITAKDNTGIAAYNIDGNQWTILEEPSKANEKITIDFEVTDSAIHTYGFKDIFGNTTEKELSAENVDNKAPVIESIITTFGNPKIEVTDGAYISSNKEYSFTINATDQSKLQYRMGEEGEWQNEPVFTATGASEYHFFVKDEFYSEDATDNNHISECIKQFQIDNDAPDIEVKVGQDEEKGKTIYTVTADDNNGSGIAAYGYSRKDDVNKKITWQESGEFSFKGSNRSVDYIFYVKDNAIPANISSFDYSVPKISVTKEPEKFTNQSIKVTVEASDSDDIVSYGYYIDDDKKNINWEDSTKNSHEFIVEDARTRYYVAKNSDGAISVAFPVDFSNFDNKAPELESVTFNQKNDQFIDKVFNILTFGFFFNEKLEITVTGKDLVGENGSSGASGVIDQPCELILRDVNGEKEISLIAKFNDLSQATFALTDQKNMNFKGKIYVVLKDNAGNVSDEIQLTQQNSNGEIFDEFMVENTAPVVSDFKYTIGETTAECSNEMIFNQNFDFKFNVNDPVAENVDELCSGIAGIKVEVNKKTVFDETYSNEKTVEKDITLKFILNEDTVKVNDTTILNKSGQLDIKITVWDNAGNVTAKTLILYTDQTAPKVTKFEFNLDPNKAANEDEITNNVQIIEYGYYFKENTELRIYASDSIVEKEIKASGLSEICVYLQSFDETFTFNSAGDLVKINDTNDAVKLIPEGENDYVEVIIPANYKGQIYAKAVDGVGNESSYVHPDGTIIENEDQHKSSSEIKIVASKPSGTQINKPTEYNLEGVPADSTLSCDMSKNVPLYSENPTFSISAIDSYSGIQELTWTIIEGENETSHSISVNNDGELDLGESDLIESEESLAVGTESNLVTSLDISGLEIEGNSNDMVLLVELTDNAGNKSYDYYVFGIDKTNPVINVAYDNNNGDTKSNDGNTYFAADRTATVTVKERNFDPENTNVEVYANGKKVAVKTDWNLTENSGNGDETTYSINISYKEDADYTFKIDSTDRAGLENDGVNYGSSVAGEKFTIDKTAPVVSVSYNNNSANNEKYFNANRTATVVIKEHNFDENRIVWTRTASLSGAPISMPGITWKHNGDTHTATIAYSADGDYTFDVSMEDKAGNKNKTVNYGSSVAAKDFVIDTHIDEPTITGVSNGYAYKDIVVPGIDFTDVNFDMSDIRITRTRLGQRDVDVTSEYIGGLSVGGQGISGVMDTFDKIREKDGIYTLYVRVVDKAGNESSNTATFTVNRFGSVYAYNQTLSDLVKDGGAYVQSVKGNLVITEYNPDKLLEGSLIIEITRDGKPISNPIYKVAPVINENVAIGESGWFQYQYTIDPENFKQDGVYKISISSKDATGNTPEIANYDDLDILFRVDNSLPELTSVVGLEKSIINANQVEVKYQVFDAIGIKSVAIYIDGKLIDKVTDFAGDLNNYTGTFVISESSSRQNVQIVVEDLAGNITDTNAEGFTSAFDFEKNVTVSTNFVIRWFANKPLFFGSIAVIAVAIGGLWFFILGKKKNEDEQ